MAGLGAWLLLMDREALRIRRKDLWCFIGTGMLSLLLFNWCFFGAIKETGMAVAGILLYTAPAFVTVMSALLFKEKLRPAGWGALALTLFGCALVSGITGSSAGISAAGILYGLGSGFGYALYSIFGRYALIRGYSPQTISFYTFALCTIGCMPFAMAAAGPGLPTLMSVPGVWAYAIALGSLSCLFPYWLYTKGLSKMTGAAASMTATFEPVVAALFGVFLYGESLTLLQGAGMLLVLGSIILLARLGEKTIAQ
jgi:drug/metabolite transporter (DMT)-like permease